ncbi:MAG: pyruvate kinase [Bacteroidota bacterium]|nr:pyruvate kinase [Bacteroidota bacterium]
MRKTKIICTIGPASSGTAHLVKLIEAGMDTARLNFSHGTYEQFNQYIEDIRQASAITGKPVAILQDLQGPKIRTGKVSAGGVKLDDGAYFIITTEFIEIGTAEKVSTTYPNLHRELTPGNTILLDDGYLILKVESIKGKEIHTKVIKGGLLKDNKGIIAPGAKSEAPSLSTKDFEDLRFGLNAGVDAVALSFVRSSKDVIELKTAMKIFGRTVPVISKIERSEAIDDIEAIIEESDAIMIARGDLGLEMPAEQVPVLQKEITLKCNYHGKPVIVATQMLESMLENPRPTRAEASDVANAVLDGADCVMLSGETSVGKYPFDAVGYMDRIIVGVESRFTPIRHEYEKPNMKLRNLSDALGKASCVIAEQIGAAAIVPLTGSGYTAKNIAKYRPSVPIICLTDDEHIQRRMSSFVWGTRAVLVPSDLTAEDIFSKLGDFVINIESIEKGSFVVFVAGLSAGKVMPENMIKVYQV